MEKKYRVLPDGGESDVLDEEQKNLLIEEILNKAKKEFETKAKADIEKIQKLIHDERQKHEDELKNRINPAEFKEYQEKSHKKEEELQGRIDELETKMKRLPLETPAGENKEPRAEFKAFENWIRRGDKALEPEEMKLLQISNMETGGYLAVDEYVADIIKTIIEWSPIRRLAKVRTTSNQATRIPKRTGTFSGYWLAEADQYTESTGLKYGLETITPQGMGALVKVTKENLEDSAFNLQGEITGEMGEQFSVLEGTAFVSGNGVNKPEGIISNAALKAAAITSTSNDAVAADDVYKLIYGIKEAYARNGTFLMKRSTVKDFRLLKESTTNAFIWQPGLILGQPQTLGGYPVEEAVDMPTVADGVYAVAFGDFKKGYTIVDRIQIEIQRLVEKYAEYGEIGFLGRKRVDGQVVNTEAIVLLKIQ